MIKKIPYITVVLIFVLSIVLEILLGAGTTSYPLELGIAEIVALLLFGAAWKRGQNPEKPFYQVVLFSLGGLFSPMIADALILEFDNIDFGAPLELLMFLAPVVPACVIGYFTRRQNLAGIVRIMMNAIPGLILTGLSMVVEISGRDSLYGLLTGLVPVVFIIIVTVLSAYAEAQIDPAERRKVQWNGWRLFLLLEIMVAIKSSSDYWTYDVYCYSIFNTLLRVMMPLLLWQYKKWLNAKTYNRNTQTVLYFIGAFLLIILQSGGLRNLMYVNYLYLYAEWILIGTVISLVVYWQKPEKLTIAGLAGSVILAAGSFGLLFATNDRLREIFYDLGGPAININLSIRANWLGYHRDTVHAYMSGDFSSLYELYSHTGNGGFMWMVDDKFMPYAFPVTVVLLLLVIITAALLVKKAGNRKMASVFAVSIILQAVISLAEYIALFAAGIGLPFTGYYIVDFVLLKWLLGSKKDDTVELVDAQEATETVSPAYEHNHKCIIAITLVLLCVIVASKCGRAVIYNTDIDESVVETYTLTEEDITEWDMAAEQIVQIISEEKPYYIVENCADLSEEEKESWKEKRLTFVESFLALEEFHPSTARDMAGLRYIKSSVVHSLLGDDTDFYNEHYVHYARLSNMKVRLLDDSGELKFCINGNHHSHIWLKEDEYIEDEQISREIIYKQMADDYPEFFSQYDEPLLRYCFADITLALQNDNSDQK